MSVHHELRQQITDAILASGAMVEDMLTGRMVVGNLDDLSFHITAALGNLEDRLQAREDEDAVGEFRAQLDAWGSV